MNPHISDMEEPMYPIIGNLFLVFGGLKYGVMAFCVSSRDQRDQRRRFSKSRSRSYSPRKRSSSRSPRRSRRSYSRSVSREKSPAKKWSSSPERNNKSEGSVGGSREGSKSP